MKAICIILVIVLAAITLSTIWGHAPDPDWYDEQQTHDQARSGRSPRYG